MKIENHQFSVKQKGATIFKEKIQDNFYSLFSQFSSSINLDFDTTLKSFNGLYGYTTYDSVQYFEKIKF